MKFVKESLYEISKAEDDWANAQIDKWRESQKSSESDLEEYTLNVVNAIWRRLRTKLSPEFLKETGTNKKTLREYITEVDSPYGLYMSVPDYWEENISWSEATDAMFDEVYRAITSQYDAM